MNRLTLNQIISIISIIATALLLIAKIWILESLYIWLPLTILVIAILANLLDYKRSFPERVKSTYSFITLIFFFTLSVLMLNWNLKIIDLVITLVLGFLFLIVHNVLIFKNDSGTSNR